MANIYRLTFRCHYQSDGTLAEPSLHYQTDNSTGGSEPDPSDLVAWLDGYLSTPFRALLNSHVTLDELVLSQEVLKPDIGVSSSVTVNGVGSYTTGAIAVPKAAVPVIDIHTGVRSKSARGWMRPPGPGIASAFNGDSWDSSYQSAAATFCALLDDTHDFGTISISTLKPVVYSPTRHKRGDDPWTFQVKSAQLNPNVRWLRSRLTSP